MKRILFFLCIVSVFTASWFKYKQVPVRVIGQPTVTGLLQNAKEMPFFAGLAAATGLPLVVNYQPLDQVGFKDTYQLPMLKAGLFDLVSLRFIQNSEIEPSLQGIDLVGLITDFETARNVAHSYSSSIDRYLHDDYDAKLLGIWTFGPQVFFCRTPIRSLEDLNGLKIRVASQSIARLISALGATPAIIPFDDTKNALAIALVDCAVTSAASGNFAGWAGLTHYYFPMPVHFGLNGYAISLKKWYELSGREQARLQAAFDTYMDDLWKFSQEMHNDSSACNTGHACKYGVPTHMTLVNPTKADVAKLREIMVTQLIPEWSARCEQAHPGCRQDWMEKVFALTH